MNLQKIINFIKSALGTILFGYYKTSDTIPFYNKKVKIEYYKLFLKRTTVDDSWDELFKPPFLDGFVDKKPSSIICTYYTNASVTIG